jgi:hypothetical protein
LARFDEGRGEHGVSAARTRGAVRACAAVAVAALVACTELAPGSDRLLQGIVPNQPDAAAPDPRWACLDESPPNTAAPNVPTIDLALGIADTVTDTVPEGLTARACDSLDANCDTPLLTEVVPSEDGVLHLRVAQGFDGYIELRSPSTVPTMYFVNRALMLDTVRSFAVISTMALNGLAMQARVPLDAALGHVLISVFDCMGAPASDIQLVSDAGGVAFVFVDGRPAVGRDVTSEDGVGGFVNVPIGYAVLEGRRANDGRVLRTTNVLVRSGWFSYYDVQP